MFRGAAGRTLVSFPEKKIRRDTHDDAVPEEVFRLLETCMPKCPYLKYVVLEQLGNGLDTEQKRQLFRRDFIRPDAIVKKENNLQRIPGENTFLPSKNIIPVQPPEDKQLHVQQLALSNILETASDYSHAVHLLQSSILSNSAWETEKWDIFMLQTAIAIAQKWKHGFN